MNWLKTSQPFNLLIIISIWVLFFAFFDVILGKQWTYIIIGLFIILIILSLGLFFYLLQLQKKTNYSVEEFEKRLKGGLYHFKCPTCGGIFAIKKSKENSKKNVKLTCPDCGAVGYIPPHPKCVEEKIPEKKSKKASFKCDLCGEGITIWAEGTDLYKKTFIYTCPFCGVKKPLKKF